MTGPPVALLYSTTRPVAVLNTITPDAGSHLMTSRNTPRTPGDLPGAARAPLVGVEISLRGAAQDEVVGRPTPATVIVGGSRPHLFLEGA